MYKSNIDNIMNTAEKIKELENHLAKLKREIEKEKETEYNHINGDDDYYDGDKDLKEVSTCIYVDPCHNRIETITGFLLTCSTLQFSTKELAYDFIKEFGDEKIIKFLTGK